MCASPWRKRGICFAGTTTTIYPAAAAPFRAHQPRAFGRVNAITHSLRISGGGTMRRTLLGLAVLAALGLAPAMALANDDQIAQAIVTKFQAQKSAGAFKDFKIGVKVEEGVVVLEGFVPSQDQLDLALDIARRVKGVKMVVNDVAI